jgi:hypothetical protein
MRSHFLELYFCFIVKSRNPWEKSSKNSEKASQMVALAALRFLLLPPSFGHAAGAALTGPHPAHSAFIPKPSAAEAATLACRFVRASDD